MNGLGQAVWRRDISSAIADLTSRIGRCPNASELAEDLGADRDEVIEKVLRIRESAEESIGKCWTGDGLDNPALIASIARLERELADSINIVGLTAILDTLTTQERSVVVLRLSKSQSQSEIAARLRISPRSVDATLARALALLRERV